MSLANSNQRLSAQAQYDKISQKLVSFCQNPFNKSNDLLPIMKKHVN